MPTVCELKIQAKAKGLTGYSKLKKDELIKLMKPKTTNATSANLNALAQKSKKKVLAITYKPKNVKNFKKNYLEELPDDLKDKIMKKKKKADDDEERDFPKIDQEARTLPKIKQRIKRIIEEMSEDSYDGHGATKLYDDENEFRDDYRLYTELSNDKIKLSDYAQDLATEYGMKLSKKSYTESIDISEEVDKLYRKILNYNLKEILVKDVNKSKGGKLKTNKQIIKEYFE